MASWNMKQVAAFVARLQMAGYKVLQLEAGWCSEVDGLQVFSAVAIGNERYNVKLNERIFPDV